MESSPNFGNGQRGEAKRTETATRSKETRGQWPSRSSGRSSRIFILANFSKLFSRRNFELGIFSRIFGPFHFVALVFGIFTRSSKLGGKWKFFCCGLLHGHVFFFKRNYYRKEIAWNSKNRRDFRTEYLLIEFAIINYKLIVLEIKSEKLQIFKNRAS